MYHELDIGNPLQLLTERELVVWLFKMHALRDQRDVQRDARAASDSLRHELARRRAALQTG